MTAMTQLAPLGLLLLAATAVTADDKKDAAFDAKKLIGDWTYTAGTKAGVKVERERLRGTVKITKDTLTLPAAPGAPSFVIAYTLDTSTAPVSIDLDIRDGPVKEGKAEGIIALDGDELKLCYTPAGGKRPARFESTKDNKAFLFTLKKAM
jgi:uncharacterized protein (TIGR03067 family)